MSPRVNDRQARLLKELNAAPEAVLRDAWQRAPASPHGDLCELLLREGQISAEVAGQVRARLLYDSDMPLSKASEPIQAISPLQRPSGSTQVPQGALPGASQPGSGSRPNLGSGAWATSGTQEGQARVIGGCRIERPIAEGGMGAVYLATSLKLGRQVALKTMKVSAEPGSPALRRFQREAETMASLNHPNIVGVLDFGVDQGIPYLIMDYVEGRTLKDLIVAGTMSPREATQLVAKVARALDAAHRRAILHRDIKPGNILIRDEDGEPLLTDFGLAKVESAERDLTLTGQVVGTPAYMSPEQANGDHELVDHRTDIFSLGTTWYEAMTRVKPFDGPDLTNLMRAILERDPIRPTAILDEVDVSFDDVCLKCLEKDPANRYYSAELLAQDLEAALEGRPTLAGEATGGARWRRWQRRNRGRVRWAAGLTLAALLFIIGHTGFRAIDNALYAGGLKDKRGRLRDVALLWNQGHRSRLDELYLQLKTGELNATEIEAFLDELGGRLRAIEQAKSEPLPEFQEVIDGHPYTRPVDAPALVEAARGRLEVNELGAYAAWLEAQLRTELGQSERADSARALAFRLGRDTEFGARATLELAQRLLERGDIDRADDAFSALRSAQASPLILGGATVGLARVRALQGRYQDLIPLLKTLPETQLRDSDRRSLSGLRVIGQQLAGALSYTGPAPCDLRGKAGEPLVIAIDKGQRRVTLRALEATKDEIVARDLADASSARVISDARAVDGRLVLEHPTKPSRSFTVLQWDGERLARIASFSGQLPGKGGHVVALGDLGGDGSLDALVSDRSMGRVLFLDIASGAPRQLSVPQLSRSYPGDYLMADIDGDGADELIAALKFYNDFGVVVLDAEGGELRTSSLLLGTMISLAAFPPAAGRRGQRLLTIAQRGERSEVGLLFGPDLSPQLPDALWLLDYDSQRAEALAGMKVWAEAFEDRERRAFVSALPAGAAFPGHPEAITATLQRSGEPNASRVYLSPLGPGVDCDLGAGVVGIADFDGDGDGELIVREGAGFRILGLPGRELAPDAPREVAREVLSFDEQLTLASTLFETGRAEPAIELLSEMSRDGSRSALERAFIELELAQAQRRAGRLDEALRTAERLERDPAFRRRALELIAAIAIDRRDARAAELSFRQLQRQGTATRYERVELERREADAREMRKLADVFALDAVRLLDSELPIGVSDLAAVDVKDGRLQLSGCAVNGAALYIPMKLPQGTLRVSLDLTGFAPGPYTTFEVGFCDPERIGQVRYGVRLVMTGNGDPMSFDRKAGIIAPSGQDEPIPLRDFSLARPIHLEWLVRPNLGLVEVSLTDPDGDASALELSQPLPRDELVYLTFKLRNTVRKTSPTARIRAIVDGLSIQAVDPIRLGDADDLPELERRLGQLLQRKSEALAELGAVTDPEAAISLAVGATRLGNLGRARELLVGVRDAADFPREWRERLADLPEALLPVLAEVIGLPRTDPQLIEVARRASAGRQLDHGLIALCHATGSPALQAHPNAGVAWVEAGATERGLAILLAQRWREEPLLRSFVALARYELGDMQGCLEAAEPLDTLPEPLVARIGAFVIRAQALTRTKVKTHTRR